MPDNIIPTPGQELSSIDFKSMLGGPLLAAIEAQKQSAFTTVAFIKEVGFKKSATKSKAGQDTGTEEPVNVVFKYPKETVPYQPALPGEVVSLTLQPGGGGTGYDPNKEIELTFSGGGGTGATGKATTNAQGTVTSVTLTSKGSGYNTKPTVELSGGSGLVVDVEIVAKKAAVEAKYEVMQLQVPILAIVPIPYIRIEEITIDFNAKIDSVQWMQIDQSLDSTVTEGGSASYMGCGVNFSVSSSYKASSSVGMNIARTYDLAVHIRAVQNELPRGMERVLGILEASMTSYPEGKKPTKQK